VNRFVVLAAVLMPGLLACKSSKHSQEKAENDLKEGLLMAIQKPLIDKAKATVAAGKDAHDDCHAIGNEYDMSKWT
jgi:hypothetical protein